MSSILTGDFEVLLRLPTYVQTVTCMETVDTFELDLTSFTRLIAKKNQTTYDYLHHVAEMKLISRVGRFKREKARTSIFWDLPYVYFRNVNGFII